MLLFWALQGCGPREGTLRERLDGIANRDLADILGELKLKGLDSIVADSTYFVIEDFIQFTGDTARLYRGYAEVHFFYLKKLKLKQVRKYRYMNALSNWDRYEVKLKHINQPVLKSATTQASTRLKGEATVKVNPSKKK